MSCCRISKQELASPGGIVMVEIWVPPPVIVRTSFGRGPARASYPWPGDWLLGLSTRTIAGGCQSDDPDASAGRGQTQ
ncbi:hypothetical protein AVEN_103577-1, partial [Araneus ventricosus]